MNRIAFVFVAALLLTGCGSQPEPEPADDGKPFRVLFETTKGNFIVKVHPDWAPNGAKRFRTLVEEGYYNGNHIFRVLRFPKKFIAQFGISGDPKTSAKWRFKHIKDDPVKSSNKRATVSFATSGKDTRTTQIFINYGDNAALDKQGFSPFGLVEEGMEIVDLFYSGYSNRVSQKNIHQSGTRYLDKYFPKLDIIKRARILGDAS